MACFAPNILICAISLLIQSRACSVFWHVPSYSNFHNLAYSKASIALAVEVFSTSISTSSNSSSVPSPISTISLYDWCKYVKARVFAVACGIQIRVWSCWILTRYVETLGDVPIRPSAMLTNHSLTLTKYVSIIIYDCLSTSVNKLVERDLLFALIPL